MRIGINALYLLPGKIGGSEIYIRNLVKWLAKVDRSNEYLIFINKESAGYFEKLAPGVKTILCPIRAASRPARILWEQIVLPFQVKLNGIDVLLSTGMTAPLICPAASFLVIFDMQHINQPQNFQKRYLFFLRSIIYLSARASRCVITISRKSKEDIGRFYKIKPDAIGITYMACDHAAFFRRTPEEISSVRKRYNLPGRFILYIASSLPHKNYERLLKAFRKVREIDKEISLVLIGARDYGQDVVSAKINELGLKNDVIFLGWLPFEDIPLIYSAAEIFVFPSLHEGFGIPVLEAMACGVPVVASMIEPIIEVAGGAALLVDPLNIDELSEGMLSVMKDSRLREMLTRDGLKRAAEFSWEKTARDTLSIIRSTLAGR